MKKTFSNIMYNGLYNLLILFIPLVTVPFISRTLGKDALGINAYVVAIATFLQLVIPAATSQIGTREVAQNQDSKELPKIFMHIWSLQFFLGIAVTAGFFIFARLTNKYSSYLLLTIPLLISSTIDVSWFFIGIGEVKKIVIRNSAIKIAFLILIFTFIRQPGDLWLYIIINSSATMIANGVFIFSLFRRFGRQLNFKYLRVSKQYLQKSIMLMIPQFAAQLYSNFDKVIMGSLAGEGQLAYYDQSQRVARMILGVVMSVSVVLMPKFAEIAAKDNSEEQVLKLLRKSLEYTIASSIFFTAILMVNTKDFVVWYWGKAFEPMIPNMFIVSLIIVFIAVGGVFANQFALGKGYYRAFSLPYIFGAVVNLPLNLLVDHKFLAMGGTLVLLFTEIVVCTARVFLLRKVLNLREVFSGMYKYIAIFAVTLVIGLVIPLPAISLFLRLALRSIVTLVIFVGLLVIFKSAIVQEVAGVIRRKFAR